MPVRTTVYLEEDVLERVRKHVPERGLSKFINQTLAEKAETLERKRIEELAIEGYIATREDRAELAQDWEVVDLEGWPD
jgi:hypothetical protein